MSQIATPREVIVLLDQVTGPTTSNYFRVFGGDYVFSVQGALGGASVQLYYRGRDGSDQIFGAARTTNDAGTTPPGGVGVGIGSAADIKVVVTGGAPVGVSVILTRLP